MDRLLELTYRAEQSHFWFRGFRKFVTPLLIEATRGRDRARALDCGCGTGSNLEMIGRFARAWGFDRAEIGVRFARAHGHRVARASVGAIPFRDGLFDLVTSFDVLQCVPDDVERTALEEMHRVLKPGGRLILNVAALEFLHGRHSVLSEEVRRYTPSRLRSVVERAGFHVDRLTFTHVSVLPLLIVIRACQRLMAGGGVEAGEFEIAVPPGPVNGALTALLSLEARALGWGNMPLGSSLLLLARKASPHA
jgi:SAM-dependent methyltransferase